MKITIIAAEFPPLNTAGSVRPFRMAQQFSKDHHDVNVLTISKDAKHNVFVKPNNLDLGNINFKITEIVPSRPERLNRNKLYDWLSTGDYFSDIWGGDVINCLKQLIQEKKTPDLILGTCPPFSTAQILRKIHKTFNIPYILDLRDAWSQWNVNPQTSFLHYLSVLRKERFSIRDSYLTLTTTEQTKKDLLRLHGPSSKIEVVENGFDAEIDFPESIEWKNPTSECVTIGYVGSFYFNPAAHKRMHDPWFKKAPHRWLYYTPRKEDWTYRSPKYFFKILKECFKLNPEWKAKINMEFVGVIPEWLPAMIYEFGFEEIVTLHGQVSLDKSLELQKNFDFFLGTSAKITGQPDYSMGSKYYEALQFKKPIIAVCSDSPLKSMVLKSNIGIVLCPDETQSSARKLEAFFNQERVRLNGTYLESLSRSNQIGKLLAIIQ